jgi:hypothetical protein
MSSKRAVLCAWLAVGIAAGCSTPSLKARIVGARLGLDGDLAAADSGVGISASSDVESLGLDDDETAIAPRVEFAWGGFHLLADTIGVEYDGQGIADADITIGGTTIPAAENVDSELDLTLSGALLLWDVVPTDLVELSLGLGVVYADESASITSLGPAVAGQRVSTDEQAPLPVVGARLGFELWKLHVEALGRGLQIDVDNVDARFFDVDASASFEFLGGGDHGSLGLVAGYRLIELDAEYEDGGSDVDIEVDFSGPYLGLAASL